MEMRKPEDETREHHPQKAGAWVLARVRCWVYGEPPLSPPLFPRGGGRGPPDMAFDEVASSCTDMS